LAIAKEILRANSFVECDEFFRVKVFRLPDVNDILETKLRRRPVMGDVIFVLPAAFHIHVARIPVAVLRHILRSEAGPDAELRVAKPVRALILVQRVPRRLEFPRRHRFIRRADDDGWHGGFRNGVGEDLRAPTIHNGKPNQNKENWRKVFHGSQKRMDKVKKQLCMALHQVVLP
jgi:hypothetical protein